MAIEEVEHVLPNNIITTAEVADTYTRSGQIGIRFNMYEDRYLIGYRAYLAINCYESRTYNPYNFLQFHLFEILEDYNYNTRAKDSWYYSNLMPTWTYSQIEQGSLCIESGNNESFSEVLGLGSPSIGDDWKKYIGTTNIFYLPEPIKLYKDKTYQIGCSGGAYIADFNDDTETGWEYRWDSTTNEYIYNSYFCGPEFIPTSEKEGDWHDFQNVKFGSKTPVCTRANCVSGIHNNEYYYIQTMFKDEEQTKGGTDCPAIIIEPIFMTYDYRYLIKNNIPTQNNITNALKTNYLVSMDTKGDWNVSYSSQVVGTSITFKVIPGVKYKITIPEGVKFLYGGTCDKDLLNDFYLGEERKLNALLYNQDIPSTESEEAILEFTAKNNDRGFVLYFNDEDITSDLENKIECIGTSKYRLYNLTAAGTIEEIIGEETFDISKANFIKSPSKKVPTASNFNNLAYPGIAYWQEYEDDNPVLELTVSGIPKAQYVTSNEISLFSEGLLKNISKMQIEANGGVLFQFSFDNKTTWKYFEPYDSSSSLTEGEWITVTNDNKWEGQNKTVTEALTLEQWSEINASSSQSYYIRAVFTEASQTLSRIGVVYV